MRLGLSIRGAMGGTVRIEGKWKLMELELGFRLGSGLGLGLQIATGVKVGARGWGVFGAIDDRVGNKVGVEGWEREEDGDKIGPGAQGCGWR